LTTGVAVKLAFPELAVPPMLYEIPDIHPELEEAELNILMLIDSPTER
jgi:hypothetical protein